jgi:hypothetical protein
MITLFPSIAGKPEKNPRCRGAVRRWKQGCYTLIHDTDSEGAEYALDTMLFCDCRGWQQEYGGFTSYIARGDDEEVRKSVKRLSGLMFSS